MNQRDIHNTRNVHNIHQPGDGFISLLEAAQSCPVKAILVYDENDNKIYP